MELALLLYIRKFQPIQLLLFMQILFYHLLLLNKLRPMTFLIMVLKRQQHNLQFLLITLFLELEYLLFLTFFSVRLSSKILHIPILLKWLILIQIIQLIIINRLLLYLLDSIKILLLVKLLIHMQQFKLTHWQGIKHLMNLLRSQIFQLLE